MSVQMKDGASVFTAILASQFYTTTNTIVIGFASGSSAVASYAIAEKVYSAIRGLMGPFVQSVFPVLAQLHDHDLSVFRDSVRSALKILIPLLFIAGLAIFLSSSFLVELIAGTSEPSAVACLRIFGIAMPFALGGFLAPMLVVRRASAVMMKITLFGAIIGVAMIWPLVLYMGAIGGAITFFIVQVYNTAALTAATRGIDGLADANGVPIKE
jgi:PST family polysaccharide transporter